MRKIVTVLSLAAVAFGYAGSSSAADLAGVEIHGFASQGFLQSTKENNFPSSNSGKGSFNFNEFGINFSKQLTPELRVGMQLFAQDRGSYGKDEVTVDWAYGDYRMKDWLGFRAGKIKNPMGLYNETRDNDALRTFVLLPQGIYWDAARETAIAVTGAGIYGTVPVGAAGSIAYQVQAGAIPLSNDGGLAQIVVSHMPGGKPTDTSAKTAFAESLEWRTPLPGLRFTATGAQADFAVKARSNTMDASIDNHNFQMYIFSAEYAYQDLVVAAEYMKQDFDARFNATTLVDLPTGLPAPMNILPAGSPISSTTHTRTDSWYVSATYRFNDLLETGAYYNEFYGDRNDRSTNYQKDAALALRIDPVKNMVLKVEGHLMNGTALLLDATGAKKDWYLFATKATFNF